MAYWIGRRNYTTNRRRKHTEQSIISGCENVKNLLLRGIFSNEISTNVAKRNENWNSRFSTLKHDISQSVSLADFPFDICGSFASRSPCNRMF